MAKDTILIEKARIFAVAAHEAVKQKRKYTEEPYWFHCREVACLVMTTMYNQSEVVAAAWLHDTVEDTGVTLDLIKTEFGPRVAELVYWLTDSEVGNRASRKAQSTIRLSNAPPDAQTIKLADLISNTGSIVSRDPGFAITYLKEKKALLKVMVDGDSTLYREALSIY